MKADKKDSILKQTIAYANKISKQRCYMEKDKITVAINKWLLQYKPIEEVALIEIYTQKK